MKKTEGFHEEQAGELKKAADASVEAQKDGEIKDEDAQNVAGGAPFFGCDPDNKERVLPVV